MDNRKLFLDYSVDGKLAFEKQERIEAIKIVSKIIGVFLAFGLISMFV